MAVTDVVLAREAAQKAVLDEALDQQARTLLQAWVKAWNEIAESYEQALVYAYQSHSAELLAVRLEQAHAIVSRQLLVLYEVTGVRMTKDVAALVAEGAAATGDMVRAQLPPSLGLVYNRVDPGQLAAIITRTTETITAGMWALTQEATEAAKLALVEGIAAGRNPRDTARRMLTRTEGVFDGGLPRALTIARTETLDAMRTASKAQEMANESVMAGWMWWAHLSSRTCPSCVAQHGKEYPLEAPGPLDHQQGRCARVPVTKTWAELGFTGVDETRVTPTDAEQWFTSLPEAEQRDLLGPARFDAWQSGNFPMSQWAQRRSTPGWRDSYAPAPAPKLVSR